MENIIISTEFLTDIDFAPRRDFKIKAVIITPKGYEKFCDMDIMGKTSRFYVKEALKAYPTFETEEKSSIEQTLAEFCDNCDYIIALFADTPLVLSSSIFDSVEYATTKNLDFCRLPRGVIVKASSLGKSFELMGEANFLSAREFMRVFDFKTLCDARRDMKYRIIESHLKSGVNILDKESVYIENDVQIAQNVTICAGNTIKGDSVISSGTYLGENNLIESSVVGENCKIICSNLKNAKVKNGSKLKFENIWSDKK